ncbi:MAG TPA: substrate-binding domain-containing protein [Acidimicrobiales bacterium]|nr:substrate-binding domain-containing protein [Acidimicrobiales bacterium]
MTRRLSTARNLAVLASAALVVAACGSATSSTTQGGSQGSSSGVSNSAAVAAAQARVAKAEQGTNRNVDPTPRPAAKNKFVVVISSGQAASSSAIPSDGAVDAARAIGWKVDLYDAALNPSNYAPLVRQAIAAGANGIILDAIDCDTVRQPLEEARAKGIAIVGIYAFDCNDPHSIGAKQSLFSANINFGPRASNLDLFAESYGADQAAYIVADSHNTAKIIAIQDPEFTVLYWTLLGFENYIKASGGSKILDTLTVTTSDLTDGQIVPKIQAELLRFPTATWIKSPYTYVTTLGIAPALTTHQGHIDVMGGEGFEDELNLLRQGKITAVNVISSDWVGWASVDTMNSVFLHQKPVDSGIGWTLVDATHNLPASGELVPSVDYKAEYKKAWGVG